MSDMPDTGAEAPQSAAAKLFDLRVMIGGLFLVYGVMLTVAGFFTSPADLAKASHININLWMGIGMLVIGGVFSTGGGRPPPPRGGAPPPEGGRTRGGPGAAPPPPRGWSGGG